MMDYNEDQTKYDNVVKKSSEIANINYYPDPNINIQTLKIDTEMAISMTEGYVKDGNKIKTCIMSSHSMPRMAISLQNNFELLPKLITNNSIHVTRGNQPVSRARSRPLSHLGIDIKEKVLMDYKSGLSPFKFKYVASLVAKYHIKNTIEIWKDICNNDLFDIWEPEAPYKNILKKGDPLILLLRVYELDEEYPYVSDNGDHSHKLYGDGILGLKEPVIEDENFIKMHKKLDEILIKHEALTEKEIYITNKIFDKDGWEKYDTETILITNFYNHLQ